MRKVRFIKYLLAPLLACFMVMVAASPASAAFTANNLMDDGMFNSNSMNASNIDSWLNVNFPNSCLSTNHGFSSPDVTGYNPSQGYLYGGNVSAGTVIYHAASAYDLNPRVLLATLQKEQSLVSGGAGCFNEPDPNWPAADTPQNGKVFTCTVSGVSQPCTYACTHSGGCVPIAVGYDCPGYCATKSEGFSKQMVKAAWSLKFSQQRSLGNYNWNIQKPGWNNSDDPQTGYSGPMTQGHLKRCASCDAQDYDGYTTIEGQSVHMDTGATVALYRYTPFFSGNQHFVSVYEGWFGPTKGIDYSWEYTGVTYSTGTNNVTGNTQLTVTISAKNTGNQAWSNTNYPVRLGTFLPTNHGSALYDPSWVSGVRPANMGKATVVPGDWTTFSFKINVPNRSGYYEEYFTLVAEGATWMPNDKFKLQLNITPATYKWQMVSQSSDKGFTLNRGDTATFTLVVRNTGTTVWKPNDYPVRLATWNPSYRQSIFNYDDANWPSAYRAATLVDADNTVTNGETDAFTFKVRAPNTPGLYVERFNLVMEGVSWFEDPWMEFDIHVL